MKILGLVIAVLLPVTALADPSLDPNVILRNAVNAVSASAEAVGALEQRFGAQESADAISLLTAAKNDENTAIYKLETVSDLVMSECIDAAKALKQAAEDFGKMEITISDRGQLPSTNEYKIAVNAIHNAMEACDPR